MAKLFDDQQRVVPTWLAAARHLARVRTRRAMNLLLEISDPLTITAEDRAVMSRVDQALAHKGLTLRTVAGTIFPLDLYKRHQRPAFYAAYTSMLKRGKKANTWGTYAARMIDRPGRPGEANINPLEMVVRRLGADGQPQRKDGRAVSFQSAYELGVADPHQDLCEQDDAAGGEVPTYDAAFDGAEWLGFPCLSHLSFKRVQREHGYAVDLTAMYRSHHYCARALGNLIGLSQLLWFVARESNLAVGTLTCLSTHAELDVSEWGGVTQARNILE
jgi:hypothetical protein